MDADDRQPLRPKMIVVNGADRADAVRRGLGIHMPPLEPPHAVQISDEEQAHVAMLRRRSYELAKARGHIRT